MYDEICPGLLECLHFFNQIQANDSTLHYFMVRFKTFLYRLSGGFFADWQGQNNVNRKAVVCFIDTLNRNQIM
jgi:hypothetical protein